MMTKRYFGFKDEEPMGRLKIKVFLIFMIAIGLFLFACITPPPKIVENKTNVTVTPNVTDIIDRPCYALDSAEKQDECYLQDAEKNSNASACLDILNAGVKDRCLLLYYHKDVELCPKFNDYGLKDSCYVLHAQRLNDSKYCNLISDNAAKVGCNELLKPKVVVLTVDELCADSTDKDDCYLGYAVLEKNVTTCSKVESETIETACIGIINNNPTLCDKFKYGETQSLCYLTYALETNSVVTCASINRTEYKNSCYQKIAVSDRKPEYCQFADPETARDKCYSEVAYETLNGTICTSVKAVDSKAACYIFTAKLASDPRICNDIESSGYKNTCYSGVITLGENLTYTGCDGITSDTWHDNCYYELARRSKDRNYCIPIYDQLLKDRCSSITN
ncbi:hypothetical protein HY570_04545 [Candidatus Micrarchaeota archaeon]|nr:hypothetical protein [Candidatus Micrarchaeota archaeon]